MLCGNLVLVTYNRCTKKEESNHRRGGMHARTRTHAHTLYYTHTHAHMYTHTTLHTHTLIHDVKTLSVLGTTIYPTYTVTS